MDTKVKYGLIGGGVLLASGILYKLLSGSSKKSVEEFEFRDFQLLENIDDKKELLLQILRHLRFSQKDIVNDIESVSQKIDEQSQGRIPKEQLQKMILGSPEVQQKIKEHNGAFFQKYNLTIEMVQVLLSNTFKNDEDVLAELTATSAALECAARGECVPLSEPIPGFLTAEKTIEIQKEILISSCVILKEVLGDLVKEAASTQQPPDYSKLQAMGDILIQRKESILKESGLDGFQDPASRIFRFAINQYKEENKNNYTQRYENLAKRHMEITNKITVQPNEEMDIKSQFADI